MERRTQMINKKKNNNNNKQNEKKKINKMKINTLLVYFYFESRNKVDVSTLVDERVAVQLVAYDDPV